MTFIVLLFLLGWLLIAVEVIVPGGILGSAGGILLLAGCIAAFVVFGPSGGALAAAVALVSGGLAIFLEFKVLPKTAIGRRAFLNAEIAGTSSDFRREGAELIGKQAEAVTMLSPSGYVRVDGKRYDAFSPSGQIPPGAPLEVVGADSFRLIVKLRQPTWTPPLSLSSSSSSSASSSSD